MKLTKRVAIPSNRVNVSHGEIGYRFPKNLQECRNPLESGQCFSPKAFEAHKKRIEERSQSPRIGSMFLTYEWRTDRGRRSELRRNPLESGQCFSPFMGSFRRWLKLASQSPRIGSMFLTLSHLIQNIENLILGRNPLESGQCFSHFEERR